MTRHSLAGSLHRPRSITFEEPTLDVADDAVILRADGELMKCGQGGISAVFAGR